MRAISASAWLRVAVLSRRGSLGLRAFRTFVGKFAVIACNTSTASEYTGNTPPALMMVRRRASCFAMRSYIARCRSANVFGDCIQLLLQLFVANEGTSVNAYYSIRLAGGIPVPGVALDRPLGMRPKGYEWQLSVDPRADHARTGFDPMSFDVPYRNLQLRTLSLEQIIVGMIIHENFGLASLVACVVGSRSTSPPFASDPGRPRISRPAVFVQTKTF